MKKFFFLLSLIIIPTFAYEVFQSKDFQYKNSSDKLLFVVDYSNSMSEYIDYQTKINQVKNMMNHVLPQISPNTKVGMRVYGHTCNLIAFNACRSSELIAPLEFNNSSNILSKMNNLRPRGMTPITYSLKQAVNKDLENFDGLKHIILLTDGGENCDESPCDYAIELMKKRRDIKIDVIAFNVNDEDDLAQLECTADMTGGHFIEADTEAKLVKAMEEMILPHKEVEAIIYK